MNTTADLENQVLELPPADRARLLLRAWDSLVDDFEVVADPTIDPEGVIVALERDAELTNGVTKLIDEVEFRRRTGL